MADDIPVVPRHPKERLPSIALKILETEPKTYFQLGRFFITVDEFETRINIISFHLLKIQSFPRFANKNYMKIKERHFLSGDLYISPEFLATFLSKEAVKPKGMFRKICRQHPFQFLLMFDLCREQGNMHAKILMCPCFMQKCQAEVNDYVKRIIHLHCKFKEKHLYFVLCCKDHPFAANYSSLMEERKCSCASGLSHEVCNFCIEARYL